MRESTTWYVHARTHLALHLNDSQASRFAQCHEAVAPSNTLPSTPPACDAMAWLYTSHTPTPTPTHVQLPIHARVAAPPSPRAHARLRLTWARSITHQHMRPAACTWRNVHQSECTVCPRLRTLAHAHADTSQQQAAQHVVARVHAYVRDKHTHTHMHMTTHVRTYVYNKVLTLCVWVRVGACMRECVHCFRKHTHGYTATGASVQRTCALSEHAAGRDVIVVRHAHARTYTHTHTHAYTYAHVASSTLVPHAKRVPFQQHTHTRAPARTPTKKTYTHACAHRRSHTHAHTKSTRSFTRAHTCVRALVVHACCNSPNRMITLYKL